VAPLEEPPHARADGLELARRRRRGYHLGSDL
jgi:hypothetical protein